MQSGCNAVDEVLIWNQTKDLHQPTNKARARASICVHLRGLGLKRELHHCRVTRNLKTAVGTVKSAHLLHTLLYRLQTTYIHLTANMSSLQDYYQKEDPVITDTTKQILTQYSGIPEQELISHIRAIVRRPQPPSLSFTIH